MKKEIKESFSREKILLFAGSLLLYSLLISVVMNLSWGEIPSEVEVGQIARHDIRADRDYQIVDEEATEKHKKEELDSALPVFDWDQTLGRQMVVENLTVLEPWREKGIVVRKIREEGQPRTVFKDFSKILSVEEARTKKSTPDVSLTLNEEETRLVREKTLEDVTPEIIQIQAEQSIIRGGDRFDDWHVTVINGIRKEKAEVLGRARFVGTFLFLALFFSVFLFFYNANMRKGKINAKDLLFQGALLFVMVIIERLLLFVSGAVRGLLPVEIPLSSFYGLIPVAAGSMMVSMVLPLPMTLLFALVGATLAGLLLQGSLHYMLFYLIGGILGIQFMRGVQTRGQILEAGLKLGIANALTLFLLDMVNITSLSGVMTTEEFLSRIALAFLGGFISAVTVLILMPVFEVSFNYLTPIKLLEYGSLNHPLLREMIVRAPGTYHHSHMVGTLAEAASEAIGADSLFARVASYFHDIGKMKKPPYFIENQPPNEDRHAGLSPSMSALIINSHVKDGLEMAKEYNLPQRIADIIPQHQGTKLISYFYNKAKEAEKASLHVIDEREFRYPGPKPQTREAGIILLADTSEAATRALKDRSPARIEEVVLNMINRNFIDGQLDECELTLKDLHTIAKSFTRILVGIYHQRVEYPPDAKETKEAKDAKAASERGGVGDKYTQSKPFGEDSLRKDNPKDEEDAPKIVHRIGSDRS
jgi:hypothetical protein